MNKANRDGLNRAQVLLYLTLDLKLPQHRAENLVAEADQYPGQWHPAGNIEIRREVKADRFDVRKK